MGESITIIGAGPAGSVAAILLARANIPVTLIEQHRFPRDKVCGECISALGIDVLQRINALDQVHKNGATKFRRASICAPNGSQIELRLPTPMLGISRERFDSQLLNLAQESGVTIRQPARCEKIEGRSIVVRDLISNRLESVDHDRVLVADGKSNERPRELGIKAHFQNIRTPRDAIELFGITGSYGGIAPIENDRFNVSFSVPIGRVNDSHGNIDAIFSRLTDENRSLQKRMRGAKRVSDWLSAPLHRSAVRAFDERIIPIGNAVAAIEPIGGEGIGLAMRSAELAVEAILNSRVHLLHREYRRLWRTRRFACRAAAKILSHPTLANFLIDGADGSDSLLTAILSMIGKSPAFA